MVLIGVAFQNALGVFGGNKGGQTALAPDGSRRGDRYDMTVRRRWFEVFAQINWLFFSYFGWGNHSNRHDARQCAELVVATNSRVVALSFGF